MSLPELIVRPLRRGTLPAIVLGLGLALSGCGFKPLYGTNTVDSTVAADLSSVNIQPAGTRIGQQVRNNLISTMLTRNNGGQKLYRLELNPTESEADIFVQEDSDVNRRNYTLRVTYSLYQAGSNRLVNNGKVFSIVAYDRVEAEFANLRTLKSAKEQASRVVADDIRTALAAYFSSR